MGAAAQVALSKRVLSTYSDLVADVDRMLGNEDSKSQMRFSKGSGGATRLIPGVYCPDERVDDARGVAMSERPPICFNRKQLSMYAMATLAGEPKNAFPLWGPWYEHAMCDWAEHNGHSRMLRTFLSSLDVEGWPIPPGRKLHWKRMQAANVPLRFNQELRNSAYKRPELVDVLIACIEAREMGSYNWMAANRLGSGAQYASHGGVATLGVMLLIGALDLPQAGNGWMESHPVGPRLAEVISLLSSEMSALGRLDWDGAAGRQLVDIALAWPYWPPSGRPCWLDQASTVAMMRGEPYAGSPNRTRTSLYMDDPNDVGRPRVKTEQGDEHVVTPLQDRVLDAMKGKAPLRKTDVASLLDVFRGQANRAVDALVKKGLVVAVTKDEFTLPGSMLTKKLEKRPEPTARSRR